MTNNHHNSAATRHTQANATPLIVATIALCVTLMLVITGCSSSTPTTTAQGPTRVVKDIDNNDVTVPEHPQRIVVLSEPTLDGLVSLGITPIGAVAGRGQRDVAGYIKPKVAQVPLLGNIAQPNFEAIGAIKPDLILVDGTSINNNPPVIAALKKIAPVVYTGYAGGDWRINFRHVADAVNQKDKGEQVLADYDKHVADVKQHLAPFANDTFSIVRWQGNSASLILQDLPPGAALKDLGLNRPEGQNRRGRGHSEPVSAENLSTIDADWIFFGTLGGSSVSNPDAGGDAGLKGAQDALTQAVDVPGFTDLGAYKNKHIIPVEGGVWTTTGGPMLMNHILDDVDTFAKTHKP